MKKGFFFIALLFVAYFTNAQCFQSAMHFPADTGLVDIGTANFNSDNIPDLVVISSVNDSIYVLLGNGDGTFGTPIVSLALPVSNQKAVSLFIEDFNRDNNMDAAIFDGTNVNILLGNGNGSFSAPTTYNAFTFRTITSMTMGDFDGDLIVDFVTYENDIMGYPNSNNDGINFLKGNGDGTFASSTVLSLISGTYQKLTTGDFNNDGKLDVACMAYPNSYSAIIALGNGDGTFYSANTTGGGTGIMGNYLPFIKAGDFDRDGILDLISSGDYLYGSLTFGVRLVYGSNNGNFRSPPEVVEGHRWASDMVLADFNGDGITDVSTSHYLMDTVSVFIGTDTGSFRAHVDFIVGDYPTGLASADFNGDGLIDIATCNRDSKDVSILLNRNPSFTITDSAANCQNIGSVRVDIQGGNPPFSYLWETGDTTSYLAGVTSGTYSLEVTDSFGCVVPYLATLASGVISIDSVIIDRSTCAAASDGSINMYTSSINPPVSYLWSTGDTTQLISGLAAGNYDVTLTDTLGCFTNSSVTLGSSSLMTDIIVLDSSGGCVSNTNGAIASVALNGEAPYSYNWSNGETTDTIAGLVAGGYTVTVTDSSGCRNIRHEFVPQDLTCYSTISGRLYQDVDSSCHYNNGDVRLVNRMVVIDPGFYARTDYNGNWTATIPQGNYKIYTSDPKMKAICNKDTITLVVPDPSPINNIDIPRQFDTVDIAGYMNCDLARLGATQTITINIMNNGRNTEPMSGVVTIDPVVTSPPTISSNNYFSIDSISATAPFKIYFSRSSAYSQRQYNFSVNVTLPPIPTTSIGQPIRHDLSVSTTSRIDQVLSNNTDFCVQEGIAAYDPNDKQVYANNVDVDGLATPADSILSYVIRFQNTGNDTARNVFIRDTIDPLLDIGTFMLTNSSHNGSVQFLQDRIIQFNFNNIYLPDSNVNEPESHGFVEYEIRVADPYQLLPITNSAAIYFDYNPPIFTNTVLTLRGRDLFVTGDSSICPGDNIQLFSDQIPVVNYYWTMNGAILPGSNSATLTATDTGAYQLYLTYKGDTLSSPIHYITSASNISLSLAPTLNNVCIDAQAVDITVTPIGGVLSGSGISGTQFNPSVAGIGTHNITYLYNDTSGCGNITATDSIVVNALPNISIIAADRSVCIDADPVMLMVSPTGGTLTGAGITGNDFAPATAGVGTHQLIYSYTDNNGCSATAEDSVTVNALPIVNISLANSQVCLDAPLVEVNTSPTGGVLSGTGVNGTDFDPATAGTGTFSVSYEYTDGNGCANSSSASVEVLELPAITFSLPSDTACTNTQPLDLEGYGSPTGGVYSGVGVSGSDLDISTPNTYTVEYTYTDNNGCASKETASLVVDVCIGIETVGDSQLSIYPNPTSGLLYIDLAGQPIDEVLVYNATGELVLQQTLNDSILAEIDLKDLPAGVHLLRTRTGEKWLQSRVVVDH